MTHHQGSTFFIHGCAPIGLIYGLVNSIVREPYMVSMIEIGQDDRGFCDNGLSDRTSQDEIFHIGQAHSFTQSWTQYDPKLTTPPGL